jgi:hypothetical protein
VERLEEKGNSKLEKAEEVEALYKRRTRILRIAEKPSKKVYIQFYAPLSCYELLADISSPN